ncbi:DUF4232 domain-containing protein [Streptomyces sp. MI02-2A]|uniref:DUF4232 domain-containing protein n=1 Tax=unclassified Streptomyces TaxID=2593676 RepID=UPI000E25AD48|nr:MULTISPECIES: DUF4232 domain-containing protein [unclassified Streptomyces]MDX3262043.1 DUF4232 domain-containing protein [Streptomyces sp. MI02-2A]
MHVATVRRAIPVLVLALAALTACGKDTEGASGVPSTASSTAHSPSSASSADPADGSASSASRSRAGAQDAGSDSDSGRGSDPQRCTSAHLRVSVENVDTAAGTTHFQLVFQNTGDSTCTLTGFPGVSFRGRDGAQIGNAADRDTDTAATTVTLIPNAHAAADAQAPSGRSGYSEAECRLKSVSFLGVFPPGSSDQIDAPWKTAECTSSAIHGLKVGPVHPIR